MSRWLPWALLVVALVVGWRVTVYELEATGAAKAQAKQAHADGVRDRAERDSALAAADRWHQAAAVWIAQFAGRDSAFRAKQQAVAGLADRYRAQRDSLLAALTLGSDTAAHIPNGKSALLAATLARCDSLAAAATDSLPCATRVAVRDSALHADSAALAEKDSALAAGGRLQADRDREWSAKLAAQKHECPKWLGFIPKPLVVAGTGLSLSSGAGLRYSELQVTAGIPIFGC